MLGCNLIRYSVSLSVLTSPDHVIVIHKEISKGNVVYWCNNVPHYTPCYHNNLSLCIKFYYSAALCNNSPLLERSFYQTILFEMFVLFMFWVACIKGE